MCIQYLQQECIDSAKNGIPPKPIPSYWKDYTSEKLQINIDEETGEVLDTEEEVEQKEFYKRLLTEKKPYYFRYIYKDCNKQYLEYIESMNVNALRNFRKSIKELQSSNSKTQEEQEFLSYYEKHLPLSNNPCVVNKIAQKVESVFDGDIKISRKGDDFDYRLYMNNDISERATNQQINKIKKIYDEYKNVNSKKKYIAEQEEKESNSKNIDVMYDVFANSIIETISDKDILCNTLVELAYKKNSISKSFVWRIVGETILENLLAKNDNTITYPVKDEHGDIVFNGDKFKLETKKVEV